MCMCVFPDRQSREIDSENSKKKNAQKVSWRSAIEIVLHFACLACLLACLNFSMTKRTFENSQKLISTVSLHK